MGLGTRLKVPVPQPLRKLRSGSSGETVGYGIEHQQADHVFRRRLPPPATEGSAHFGMGSCQEYVVAMGRLPRSPVGVPEEYRALYELVLLIDAS